MYADIYKDQEKRNASQILVSCRDLKGLHAECCPLNHIFWPKNQNLDLPNVKYLMAWLYVDLYSLCIST
jgi:hypothetical protein